MSTRHAAAGLQQGRRSSPANGRALNAARCCRQSTGVVGQPRVSPGRSASWREHSGKINDY
jgi:hypothetical protein